jgi:hypothetical protein
MWAWHIFIFAAGVCHAPPSRSNSDHSAGGARFARSNGEEGRRRQAADIGGAGEGRNVLLGAEAFPCAAQVA